MSCERALISFGKFKYYCLIIKLSGYRAIVLLSDHLFVSSFNFVLQWHLSIVRFVFLRNVLSPLSVIECDSVCHYRF